MKHHSIRLLAFIIIFLSYMVETKPQNTISYLYSSSNEIEVVGFEYGMDKTTVSFVSDGKDSRTLCIGHGIYIVGDDGKRHYVTGTEGISLDSVYTLGAGDKMEFSIDYSPVDVNNSALDIRDPLHFIILGIHDAGTILPIPKANGEVPHEETDFLLYQPQTTYVEGIMHDPFKVYGEQLYCNYEAPRPYLREEDTKKAYLDEQGHFKVEFTMYSPQFVDLRKSRLSGGNPAGFIYVRPGDRIIVEMYDNKEAKEILYHEQTGRKAYNKLANCPYIPFKDTKYVNNLLSDFVHFSYQQHQEMLRNEYQKALEHADYICWHYGLSPYETQLYLNMIKRNYIGHMMNADIRVYTCYRNAKTEERQKWEKTMNTFDYSYLKEIDPDNVSRINSENIRIEEMAEQLPLFQNCIKLVPENTPNRWRKIIELQQEELNRITGWTGRTFFMEMLIASEAYGMVFRHHISETELEEIKAMLSHPYCKQYVDIVYNEYKLSH